MLPLFAQQTLLMFLQLAICNLDSVKNDNQNMHGAKYIHCFGINCIHFDINGVLFHTVNVCTYLVWFILFTRESLISPNKLSY